jgi:hypothetical protein
MTATVEGPAWSLPGLEQRAGRYPLMVEGPVLRAVDILAPGLSSVTRYIRYYALYATLAAHAQRLDLDAAACRRLLRRSEVILAAVSHVHEDVGNGPGTAHGVDRVRRSLDDGLDVANAAAEKSEDTYSPRAWGFWSQYGGPSTVLGTVSTEDGALRPGRHACPSPVSEMFAPLFAAAEHNRLTMDDLHSLGSLALQAESAPEVPWLGGLFSATSKGHHEPDAWRADDRRRRASMRMLGRAIVLYGHEADQSWDDTVRSAVAFGDQIETDPVLSGIREVVGWRGILLRHYSVGAWRRLWASLVRSIGTEGEDADSSAEELRSWLADQMPGAKTVGAFLADLPPTTFADHPAPAERVILAERDRGLPLTNVCLLLLGGRRSRELAGDARTAFLGNRHDILNPEWVHLRAEEYADRPLSDLAVRLVDDMLAQARRVALSKMRFDKSGKLKVFSRLHERNGRYYKTSDEGDSELGTRIVQLAMFSEQLGLVEVAENGAASVTPLGASVLQVGE